MSTATATLVAIHVAALLPRPSSGHSIVAIAWLHYLNIMPVMAIGGGADALSALQHIYAQANGLLMATRGDRN